MPGVNPPRVPEGLRDLMKSLTKEVLREKPPNVYEFSAQYFEAILDEKRDFTVKGFEPPSNYENFQHRERNQVPLSLVYTIIPEGLTELIKEFIKAVLRANPNNICEFAVEYFRRLRNDKNLDTVQYTAYENYFKSKDRFSFTPYLKCSCGRKIGEGMTQEHYETKTDVSVVSRGESVKSDSFGIVQTCTGKNECNNAVTKVVKEKNLINEQDSKKDKSSALSNSESIATIDDGEKYIHAIFVIQRFFRKCLLKKTNRIQPKESNESTTTTGSGNTMTEEAAALVIQRSLRKLFDGKFQKHAVPKTISIVPKLENFSHNDDPGDNVSEAASYTSASTALMSAESVGENSEIGMANYDEGILQKTIMEDEEVENDYSNSSNEYAKINQARKSANNASNATTFKGESNAKDQNNSKEKQLNAKDTEVTPMHTNIHDILNNDGQSLEKTMKIQNIIPKNTDDIHLEVTTSTPAIEITIEDINLKDTPMLLDDSNKNIELVPILNEQSHKLTHENEPQSSKNTPYSVDTLHSEISEPIDNKTLVNEQIVTSLNNSIEKTEHQPTSHNSAAEVLLNTESVSPVKSNKTDEANSTILHTIEDKNNSNINSKSIAEVENDNFNRPSDNSLLNQAHSAIKIIKNINETDLDISLPNDQKDEIHLENNLLQKQNELYFEKGDFDKNNLDTSTSKLNLEVAEILEDKSVNELEPTFKNGVDGLELSASSNGKSNKSQILTSKDLTKSPNLEDGKQHTQHFNTSKVGDNLNMPSRNSSPKSNKLNSKNKLMLFENECDSKVDVGKSDVVNSSELSKNSENTTIADNDSNHSTEDRNQTNMLDVAFLHNAALKIQKYFRKYSNRNRNKRDLSSLNKRGSDSISSELNSEEERNNSFDSPNTITNNELLDKNILAIAHTNNQNVAISEDKHQSQTDFIKSNKSSSDLNTEAEINRSDSQNTIENDNKNKNNQNVSISDVSEDKPQSQTDFIKSNKSSSDLNTEAGINRSDSQNTIENDDKNKSNQNVSISDVSEDKPQSQTDFIKSNKSSSDLTTEAGINRSDSQNTIENDNKNKNNQNVSISDVSEDKPQSQTDFIKSNKSSSDLNTEAGINRSDSQNTIENDDKNKSNQNVSISDVSEDKPQSQTDFIKSNKSFSDLNTEAGINRSDSQNTIENDGKNKNNQNVSISDVSEDKPQSQTDFIKSNKSSSDLNTEAGINRSDSQNTIENDDKNKNNQNVSISDVSEDKPQSQTDFIKSNKSSSDLNTEAGINRSDSQNTIENDDKNKNNQNVSISDVSEDKPQSQTDFIKSNKSSSDLNTEAGINRSDSQNTIENDNKNKNNQNVSISDVSEDKPQSQTDFIKSNKSSSDLNTEAGINRSDSQNTIENDGKNKNNQNVSISDVSEDKPQSQTDFIKSNKSSSDLTTEVGINRSDSQNTIENDNKNKNNQNVSISDVSEDKPQSETDFIKSNKSSSDLNTEAGINRSDSQNTIENDDKNKSNQNVSISDVSEDKPQSQTDFIKSNKSFSDLNTEAGINRSDSQNTIENDGKNKNNQNVSISDVSEDKPQSQTDFIKSNKSSSDLNTEAGINRSDSQNTIENDGKNKNNQNVSISDVSEDKPQSQTDFIKSNKSSSDLNTEAGINRSDSQNTIENDNKNKNNQNVSISDVSEDKPQSQTDFIKSNKSSSDLNTEAGINRSDSQNTIENDGKNKNNQNVSISDVSEDKPQSQTDFIKSNKSSSDLNTEAGINRSDSQNTIENDDKNKNNQNVSISDVSEDKPQSQTDFIKSNKSSSDLNTEAGINRSDSQNTIENDGKNKNNQNVSISDVSEDKPQSQTDFIKSNKSSSDLNTEAGINRSDSQNTIENDDKNKNNQNVSISDVSEDKPQSQTDFIKSNKSSSDLNTEAGINRSDSQNTIENDDKNKNNQNVSISDVTEDKPQSQTDFIKSNKSSSDLNTEAGINRSDSQNTIENDNKNKNNQNASISDVSEDKPQSQTDFIKSHKSSSDLYTEAGINRSDSQNTIENDDKNKNNQNVSISDVSEDKPQSETDFIKSNKSSSDLSTEAGINRSDSQNTIENDDKNKSKQNVLISDVSKDKPQSQKDFMISNKSSSDLNSEAKINRPDSSNIIENDEKNKNNLATKHSDNPNIPISDVSEEKPQNQIEFIKSNKSSSDPNTEAKIDRSDSSNFIENDDKNKITDFSEDKHQSPTDTMKSNKSSDLNSDAKIRSNSSDSIKKHDKYNLDTKHSDNRNGSICENSEKYLQNRNDSGKSNKMSELSNEEKVSNSLDFSSNIKKEDNSEKDSNYNRNDVAPKQYGNNNVPISEVTEDKPHTQNHSSEPQRDLVHQNVLAPDIIVNQKESGSKNDNIDIGILTSDSIIGTQNSQESINEIDNSEKSSNNNQSNLRKENYTTKYDSTGKFLPIAEIQLKSFKLSDSMEALPWYEAMTIASNASVENNSSSLTQKTPKIDLETNDKNSSLTQRSVKIDLETNDPKKYDIFYQESDPEFSDSLNETKFEPDSLEIASSSKETDMDEDSLELDQSSNNETKIEKERTATYLYGIHTPRQTPTQQRNLYKSPTTFTIPFNDNIATQSNIADNNGKSLVKEHLSEIDAMSHKNSNLHKPKELDLSDTLNTEVQLDMETPTKLFAELNAFDLNQDEDTQYSMDATYTAEEKLTLNSAQRAEIKPYSDINELLENIHNDDEISVEVPQESLLHTIEEDLNESVTPRPDHDILLSDIMTNDITAELIKQVIPSESEDALDNISVSDENDSELTSSWTCSKDLDETFLSDEYLNENDEDTTHYRNKRSTPIDVTDSDAKGGIYEIDVNQIKLEESKMEISDDETLTEKSLTHLNATDLNEDHKDVKASDNKTNIVSMNNIELKPTENNNKEQNFNAKSPITEPVVTQISNTKETIVKSNNSETINNDQSNILHSNIDDDDLEQNVIKTEEQKNNTKSDMESISPILLSEEKNKNSNKNINISNEDHFELQNTIKTEEVPKNNDAISELNENFSAIINSTEEVLNSNNNENVDHDHQPMNNLCSTDNENLNESLININRRLSNAEKLIDDSVTHDLSKNNDLKLIEETIIALKNSTIQLSEFEDLMSQAPTPPQHDPDEETIEDINSLNNNENTNIYDMAILNNAAKKIQKYFIKYSKRQLNKTTATETFAENENSELNNKNDISMSTDWENNKNKNRRDEIEKPNSSHSDGSLDKYEYSNIHDVTTILNAAIKIQKYFREYSNRNRSLNEAANKFTQLNNEENNNNIVKSTSGKTKKPDIILEKDISYSDASNENIAKTDINILQNNTTDSLNENTSVQIENPELVKKLGNLEEFNDSIVPNEKCKEPTLKKSVSSNNLEMLAVNDLQSEPQTKYSYKEDLNKLEQAAIIIQKYFRGSSTRRQFNDFSKNSKDKNTQFLRNHDELNENTKNFKDSYNEHKSKHLNENTESSDNLDKSNKTRNLAASIIQNAYRNYVNQRASKGENKTSTDNSWDESQVTEIYVGNSSTRLHNSNYENSKSHDNLDISNNTLNDNDNINENSMQNNTLYFKPTAPEEHEIADEEEHKTVKVNWFVGNEPIVYTVKSDNNVDNNDANINLSTTPEVYASSSNSNACSNDLNTTSTAPLVSPNINSIATVKVDSTSSSFENNENLQIDDDTNIEPLKNLAEIVSAVESDNIEVKSANSLSKEEPFNEGQEVNSATPTSNITEKVQEPAETSEELNSPSKETLSSSNANKSNSADDNTKDNDILSKPAENKEDLKYQNIKVITKAASKQSENDSSKSSSEAEDEKQIKTNAQETQSDDMIKSDITIDLTVKDLDSAIPYEILEEPCIKKSFSQTHLDELVLTQLENNFDNKAQNDAESTDSHDDTIDAITEKLRETEGVIEKMQQRRASETKSISVEEKSSKSSSFDEPVIRSMQELQTNSTPDLADDEAVVVLSRLQRDDTRESSAQSDSVVFGDDDEDEKAAEEEFDESPMVRASLKRLHTIAGGDPKQLFKSVTIDDTIKYIEPPENETTATSDSSFCLDDDTSENIRQKMMAYSLSEADSDFFVSMDKAKVNHDDFNISTALLDTGGTSTDTESTIVSAATKIQAGARGFITRRRLRRASAGTNTFVQDEKASFGNDAISESLEKLIEYEAAKKIQHAYRKHYWQKKAAPGASLEDGDFHSTSLAAKRLTLQRGDALRNDSAPDEENGSNGSGKDAVLEKSTDVEVDSAVGEAVKSTGTAAPSAHNTATAVAATATPHKVIDNKLKWLALRQNSMPVQIDCEVFRVIPKHMRKRIKSAEGVKKGRRILFKD